MSYTIRLARPEESPILADIETAAAEKFRGIGMDQIFKGFFIPPERYRPHAEEKRVFVAVDAEGHPVGFAILGLLDGEPYLAELDVHPAHERKGLGRRLMAAAEGWARDAGGTSLLLSTYRDIPWNGPYYARLGFNELQGEECNSPGMLQQRAREAAGGNIMSRRCFMRKQFISDKPAT